MRIQHLRGTLRSVICMRLAIAFSAVVATLVVFFAPAAVSADVELKQQYLTGQQARLIHGEDLFVELCAVCHGNTGKGDGPAVPALEQVPTDLTLLKARNNGEFPRDALEKYIYGRNRIDAHGTVDMPIWGRAFEFTKPDLGRVQRINFAQHRIHNIVDYIESLQVE